MNSPKITFLVNSGPDSIEAVRARGLARRLPPDKTRFLFRDGSRIATGFRWDAELKRDRPDLLYGINTAMPGAALAVWWRRRHGIPYLLDTGDAIHPDSAGLFLRTGRPEFRPPHGEAIRGAYPTSTRPSV